MAFSFGRPSGGGGGGFQFASGSLPTAGAAPMPTPATDFPFTGGASNPFSLSSSASSTAPTTPTTPLLTVPDYDSLFIGRAFHQQVSSCIHRCVKPKQPADALAGQELLALIQQETWKQHLVPYKATTTQQTTQTTTTTTTILTPQTVLYQNQPALLTATMCADVFLVARDLDLSEWDALALYAKAMSVDKAKELFMQEYSSLLQALWMIVQAPLLLLMRGDDDDDHQQSDLVQACEILLQQGLVLHLLQALQEYASSWSHKSDSFGPTQMHTIALILCTSASTQSWSSHDVVAVVHALQQLSNALPILDPFDHVPSPFVNEDDSTMLLQAHFSHALPPFQDKDALQWQHELVSATRQEQSQLQTVALLTMTVVVALTQSPMQQEGGPAVNAIAIDPTLESKLSRAAASDWKRLDVLGLVLAAYAIRTRSANPNVRTWRECLEAPMEWKSFSFGRLAFIPALESMATMPSPAGLNTEELLLKGLAAFAATYLDILSVSGDLPVSRLKWEQDAEEDLRLRRSHQEQQRQFQAWSGTTAGGMERIPSSVDLLERPDCMDDVVAFVVTVCSLGPSYALQFWSREQNVETGRINLVPSRALLELDRLQEGDESLGPSYVSFLAVLALADDTEALNGASAVHKVLSSPSDENRKGQVTWTSILEALRWYTREFNNSKGGFSSAPTKKVSSYTSTPSSYYYSNETGSAGFSTKLDSSSDGGQSVSQPFELGALNSHILSSYLSVLANVAAKCPPARSAVLSTPLPIFGSDASEVIGQDTSLVILFTLSVAPVSPEIRGAVFVALSEILSGKDAAEKDAAVIRDAAIKAWQLVEDCQFIPIALLDQFPVDLAVHRRIMSFPQSSTMMAVPRERESWVPPNPDFCILYEMEYLESIAGVYPSTEGFLRLLRSLFQFGGSPQTLGENWRRRSGCSPYMEYVTNLVLPRAMGTFHGFQQLRFNSTLDRQRFVAHGLRVVEILVTTYRVFPPPSGGPLPGVNPKKDMETIAEAMFGRSPLRSSLLVEPSADEERLFRNDWGVVKGVASDEGVSKLDYSSSETLQVSGQQLAPPRAKSPAFSACVDVLTARGFLMAVLIDVVREFSDNVVESLKTDALALAYGLFNLTPPTFERVKESRKKSGVPRRQQLLVSLLTRSDRPTSLRAVEWSEKGLLQALRILCAVVIRESALSTSLDAARGKVHLVPVLRFQPRGPRSTSVYSLNLQLSPVSEQLLSSNSDIGVVSRIVAAVGYQARSETVDSEIATMSSALLFYLNHAMRSRQNLAAMYPSVREGELAIGHAFGKRLFLLCQRPDYRPDKELAKLVLHQILADLRHDAQSPTGMAWAMLGLLTAPLNPSFCEYDPKNCLESLLLILSDIDFVLGEFSSDLAVDGFETLYRLMRFLCADPSCSENLFSVAQWLRDSDFYRIQLQHTAAFVAGITETESNMNVLHSIAWTLKGLACEIQLATTQQGSISTQLGPMLSFLFCNPHEVLVTLVGSLPNGKRPQHDSDTIPSEATVHSSKVNIEGAPEVTGTLTLLDEARIVEYGRKLPTGDESARKDWPLEWSLAALREYASAHLSDAIHLVLGSYVTSGFPHAERVRNGATALLATILSVLTSSRNMKALKDLDEVYFGKVTRNLSLAAFSAAQIVLAIRSDGSDDLMVARALFARAITFSGASHDGDAVASNAIQRTAILSSGLSLLLGTAQTSMVLNPEDFFTSSSVLLRVGHLCQGTAIGLAAYSTVSLILDHMQNSQSSVKDCAAFVKSLLFQPVSPSSRRSSCQLLVGQMRSCDPVMVLLMKIALMPGGAESLCESGILNEMYTYAGTLERDWQHIEFTSRPFDETAPPFLSGQLQLLTLLLLADSVVTRKEEVALKAIDVLRCYGPALEHFFKRFQSNGELVLAAMQCLNGVASSFKSSKRLLPSDNGQNKGHPSLGSLLLCTKSLVARIAEHPLPPGLLPSIPAALSCGNEAEKHSPRSWWDYFDAHTTLTSFAWRQPSISEQNVGRGIAGSQLLLTGIQNDSVAALLDTSDLARGLCRCADALQLISQRVPKEPSAWSQSPAVEANLGMMRLLRGIVSRYLLLLLVRLRDEQNNSHRSESMESGADTKKRILVALDYTRLDRAIFAPEVVEGDENTPDSLTELAIALRNALMELQRDWI